MIIGIGKGPLSYFVWKYLRELVGETLLPYPLFYDAKRELLTRKLAYIDYLRKLQLKRNEVRIAVYPDYLLPQESRVSLSPLKSIEFIVPVHSFEDLRIVEELQKMGFKVYYGYASDRRYRNYTLSEFLRVVKGDRWYLGVSTQHELREALTHGFDGMDITAYLFGRNDVRKNPLVLKEKVKELITKTLSCDRQKRIMDFVS
ncbi:hypothetical protein [Sulfurisphaera ohwakuensis]|uniref:hypothetical protein n=1 Tax=Sulfurisphaera ohwakuensis TaxID=69656 RepID=UPI0036F2E3DD